MPSLFVAGIAAAIACLPHTAGYGSIMSLSGRIFHLATVGRRRRFQGLHFRKMCDGQDKPEPILLVINVFYFKDFPCRPSGDTRS